LNAVTTACSSAIWSGWAPVPSPTNQRMRTLPSAVSPPSAVGTGSGVMATVLGLAAADAAAEGAADGVLPPQADTTMLMTLAMTASRLNRV
jgi:hypothetical protein